MTRKDDVMLIIELHKEVELLKTALQYSNSTAKLALSLIKTIGPLDKSAIARDLEEMIEKTRKVLERKDHKNEV